MEAAWSNFIHGETVHLYPLDRRLWNWRGKSWHPCQESKPSLSVCNLSLYQLLYYSLSFNSVFQL